MLKYILYTFEVCLLWPRQFLNPDQKASSLKWTSAPAQPQWSLATLTKRQPLSSFCAPAVMLFRGLVFLLSPRKKKKEERGKMKQNWILKNNTKSAEISSQIYKIIAS